jgi:hypothetical protein
VGDNGDNDDRELKHTETTTAVEAMVAPEVWHGQGMTDRALASDDDPVGISDGGEGKEIKCAEPAAVMEVMTALRPGARWYGQRQERTDTVTNRLRAGEAEGDGEAGLAAYAVEVADEESNAEVAAKAMRVRGPRQDVSATNASPDSGGTWMGDSDGGREVDEAAARIFDEGRTVYNLPAAWKGGKCQADAVLSEIQPGANAAASLSVTVDGDSELVPQDFRRHRAEHIQALPRL